MTIAVIDYGMGNLHSVAKALEHVTHEHVVVTRDARRIQGATRLVLPGQGAIRDCMGELERTELRGLVEELLAQQAKPLLGICVGQQMLHQRSEENGGIDCLGFMTGQVRRFPVDMRDDMDHRLKVPHMGWNLVRQRHDHPLWKGIDDQEHFYFVHSYYVEAGEDAQVFGTTDYGRVTAHVATGRDATFAVQFHPEKSSRAGLRLLENFVQWEP
ncbi:MULTISPECIES: imidazole glycerol phosphate synthase subunit HisH [Halomonas]|uniref:Imidazole glycerol phosphate synthase subunit HisH n=2 Tax=Halomonas TaxID=2745 RepID=A0ABQ0U422_9GAMM|nr:MULTISPECIES: imidazole glycerol phosphate synthase subunit HisH [Halomonas]PSJ21203.1 imidazole glycerol phosphate synthase subunit HisH [Halomonas sp. ND22Bw]KGE78499.1 imidazole glycerol phosphate synthase [Halomonas salina]MDR5890656.1 imidazole glycerol phosphate synthase subunit HisH [Halomonas salina]RAH36317.1 imidazole glycerol phosphate synthase subunit HisH [Halomonas sp. SL1]WJY07580.1 imidazole glycerol phosphate synthase subunit HisH [Halomonas halophila]